ncbi:hypothetical protein [uncultured Polaribacter sp.]|uniref:hypothetical protein n=1 Tax=uncultured Polaribacter sp. TaxID=174711 RepID=UPI00261A02E9|nr:hypothetical protein [uncultured Polaribacter sp.]
MLFVQFAINKNGELVNKKSRVPDGFINEIEKTLNSFPIVNKVATFNNDKIESLYSFSIRIKNDEKPVYKERFSTIKKITKPTRDNLFSTYLSKNLPEEIIKKADLNRINSRLSINFELDKNNRPFNLKSNSRSEELENKIFTLFKKYPTNKFNITDSSNFNNYGLQILSFEDNESKINTSTTLSSEKPPIFPGCENSINIKELKNCFSKGVQMHFSRKFDASLPNRLGLSKGKKRVFIGFKIDRNGDINDVKVRAPHPAITAEVKRVMYELPKIIAGKQTGINVGINYNIPFTLMVD